MNENNVTTPDPLDDPAYIEGIELVTKYLAHQFDKVWSRPDGPAILRAFIQSGAGFVISQAGIAFLTAAELDRIRLDPPAAADTVATSNDVDDDLRGGYL